MSLYDCNKIGGIGTCAIGKVVSGELEPYSIINIAPENSTVNTRTLEYDNESIEKAMPGSFVSIKVNDLSYRDIYSG